MKKENHNSKTLELIFSEVKERLNIQFQSIDSLDTKAGIIMGFVGIILGIILQKPYNNFNFFLLSSILFLLSIFFAFFAYKTGIYRRDPEPQKFVEKYLLEDNRKVKKQLLYNFVKCFNENKVKLEKKAKYINFSLLFLLLGVISLILINMV